MQDSNDANPKAGALVFDLSASFPMSLAPCSFVFLIGVVDQDAVIVIGGVFQALKNLVPIGRDFVDEDHSLAGEANLQESNLADKLS
jgi:hypothetical protein